MEKANIAFRKYEELPTSTKPLISGELATIDRISAILVRKILVDFGTGKGREKRWLAITRAELMEKYNGDINLAMEGKEDEW